MLVLSRKQNESLTLEVDGRRIVVTVVDISGNRIRLGVEADRDVNVYRSEIAGTAGRPSKAGQPAVSKPAAPAVVVNHEVTAQ